MQAGEKLSFIVPIQEVPDNVGTGEEVREIKRAYVSMCEFLTYRFKGEVETVDTTLINGVKARLNELILQLDAPDGSYLRVNIHWYSTPNYDSVDNNTLTVLLSDHQADGRRARIYSYGDTNGRIVRFDNIIPPQLEEYGHFSAHHYNEIKDKLAELSRSEWDADREMAEAYMASIHNMQANRQLEEAMGVNGRPITQDELQQLEQLLTHATPVPRG